MKFHVFMLVEMIVLSFCSTFKSFLLGRS